MKSPIFIWVNPLHWISKNFVKIFRALNSWKIKCVLDIHIANHTIFRYTNIGFEWLFATLTRTTNGWPCTIIYLKKCSTILCILILYKKKKWFNKLAFGIFDKNIVRWFVQSIMRNFDSFSFITIHIYVPQWSNDYSTKYFVFHAQV